MKSSTLSFTSAEVANVTSRTAIGGAVAAVLFLLFLHFLSPEFDPAWRVVSEYANGKYSWVLSLMFLSTAIGNWALAFAIHLRLRTRGGKIGLSFLILAGIGSAMASVFTINHPLHNVAGMLGVIGSPVGAVITSVNLSRKEPFSASRKLLMRTAHLTWIVLLLFIVSMIVMISTYLAAGGDMNVKSDQITELPPGVIAFVGYPNRLMIIVNNLWVATAAWLSIRYAAD